MKNTIIKKAIAFITSMVVIGCATVSPVMITSAKSNKKSTVSEAVDGALATGFKEMDIIKNGKGSVRWTLLEKGDGLVYMFDDIYFQVDKKGKVSDVQITQHAEELTLGFHKVKAEHCRDYDDGSVLYKSTYSTRSNVSKFIKLVTSSKIPSTAHLECRSTIWYIISSRGVTKHDSMRYICAVSVIGDDEIVHWKIEV